MTSGAWVSVTIEVEAAHAQALSDALLALGAFSVDIAPADPADQGLAEEPEEPGSLLWPRVRLAALVAPQTDPARLAAEAAEKAGLKGLPSWEASSVEEQNWVRLTQSQFAPLRVSPRLWVVPSWHEPPDPSALNLRLDPGLAFGTGAHPTTRLCLAWLDEAIQGGEHVLDYGCGSGILAIASLKLGAARAVGVDIDPEAVRVARENAARNSVAAEFYQGEAPAGFTAHVVVANILANPLKLLAPVLAQATRRGGRIVLSGLLREQAGEVAEGYRPWFDLSLGAEEEGWVCLTGVKRRT